MINVLKYIISYDVKRSVFRYRMKNNVKNVFIDCYHKIGLSMVNYNVV